jgi:hypothetical protein
VEGDTSDHTVEPENEKTENAIMIKRHPIRGTPCENKNDEPRIAKRPV